MLNKITPSFKESLILRMRQKQLSVSTVSSSYSKSPPPCQPWSEAEIRYQWSMIMAVDWNYYPLWFCCDDINDVRPAVTHLSSEAGSVSLNLSLPVPFPNSSLFLYWLFGAVTSGSIFSLSHTLTHTLFPFLSSKWMFRTFFHWGKIPFQSLHFIVGTHNLLACLLSPPLLTFNLKESFLLFYFFFLAALLDSLQVSYIQPVKAELAASVCNHSVAGAAAPVQNGSSITVS